MWQNNSAFEELESLFHLYIMAAEICAYCPNGEKNKTKKAILCSGYVFRLMLLSVAMAMIALILQAHSKVAISIWI